MISYVVLALAAFPAALVVWNLAILTRRAAHTATLPSISVLIPARNEAANIGPALRSVLDSGTMSVEVLVLDDHSTDDTAAIVTAIAADDPRVRLLRGRDLPAGLCGKPYACAQLAEHATGELLVFMDADVRLSDRGLELLARNLVGSGADMVSGIPHQLTEGLAEKIIVPLMHFIMFAYLPVALMRRYGNASFGAACGQLLAVRRSAYEQSGGHLAIADRVHDGIALARLFRSRGFMTDIADIDRAASCRMYTTTREVFAGFVKNAHEGLGSNRGILPWTVLLTGGQVLPWLALPFAGAASPFGLALLAVIVGRLLLTLRFRQSWLGALLHPIGVALLVGIQWYALVQRLRGRHAAWKGRIINA